MSPSDRIGAAGWRLVLLASLGGALEFYDFVIFGIFARDIADAVFPLADPLASLMASFGAFAAAISHGRSAGSCSRTTAIATAAAGCSSGRWP